MKYLYSLLYSTSCQVQPEFLGIQYFRVFNIKYSMRYFNPKMVRTDHGKPRKSWNFRIPFSRPFN